MHRITHGAVEYTDRTPPVEDLIMCFSRFSFSMRASPEYLHSTQIYNNRGVRIFQHKNTEWMEETLFISWEKRSGFAFRRCFWAAGICELLPECALKMVLVDSIVLQFKFWSGSNRFHIWMSQKFGLKGKKYLNTTVSTVQFHFSVSFADLKWLRGLKCSFEKQNRSIEVIPGNSSLIFQPANSPITDVTRNIYSWMLFSSLTLSVFRPVLSSSLWSPLQLWRLLKRRNSLSSLLFSKFTFKLTSCHPDLFFDWGTEICQQLYL